MPRLSRLVQTPKHQTNLNLQQAAPVQNQWYVVLEDKNVRLYHLTCQVADVGETLEAKLTVDGVEYSGSQAAVAGTGYYLTLSSTPNTLVFITTAYALDFYIFIEARSVKLEIRKTTAAGAGTIQVRGVWAKD